MLTNTDLYNADFVAWCDTTAALLRAGQWGEIDMEALAEEIESLGRSQKRELESRLEVLVMHLLKWEYQPERRIEGHSWASTIQEQRRGLARLLRDTPSLRPQVAIVLAAIYPGARQHAIDEMMPGWPLPPFNPFGERRGSVDPASLPLPAVLPLACPWSADQVLALDFWPISLP